MLSPKTAMERERRLEVSQWTSCGWSCKAFVRISGRPLGFVRISVQKLEKDGSELGGVELRIDRNIYNL